MSVNYQHKYLKYKMKYHRLLQIGGEGVGDKILHRVCKKGMLDVVKEYVVKRGADVNSIVDNYTPLTMACENGHIDIVKWLVDVKGVDVNKISETSPKKFTPLFHASMQGHSDIVKYLIESGATDDYVTDSTGNKIPVAEFLSTMP